MNLEYRAVSGLSGIAPWLAPIPSAFLVYRGLTSYLQFPDVFAVASAAGVEALGIAAINTALWLHNYNTTKRKSDPAANTSAALWAAGVYLAVTTIVNVLLDIGTRPALQIMAQAVLSVLPISGALILATRAEHGRRLEDIAQCKADAKAARIDAKPQTHNATVVTHSDGYSCVLCNFETDNRNAYASHMRWMHKKNGTQSAKVELDNDL